MYNESKKELLVTIADALNAKGWKDPDSSTKKFSVDDGIVANLGFLPEENLNKILEIGFDGAYYYSSLYQQWGREGVFKMEPYITHEHGFPVLVLRHNRFLYLFKDMYFQVTSDVNLEVSCSSGSYDISFLANLSPEQHVSRSSLLAYMIWWAALIDVGFRYDVFRATFEKSSKLIEEFIHETISDATINWFRVNDYNINCLDKYVSAKRGTIDRNKRAVHHIVKDGAIQADIAMGSSSIEVELAGDLLITVKVPAIDVGTGYCPSCDSHERILKDTLNCYERHHYIEILALMALKIAGLHLSEMSVRWIDKQPRDTMTNAIPDIKGLRDFREIETDNM